MTNSNCHYEYWLKVFIGSKEPLLLIFEDMEHMEIFEGDILAHAAEQPENITFEIKVRKCE